MPLIFSTIQDLNIAYDIIIILILAQNLIISHEKLYYYHFFGLYKLFAINKYKQGGYINENEQLKMKERVKYKRK